MVIAGKPGSQRVGISVQREVETVPNGTFQPTL